MSNPKAEQLKLVIDEVISTEESYVTSIRKAVEIAIPLFRAKLKKRKLAITEKKITGIFSNIETILNFSETLLKEVKTREISRVFLEYSDMMKLYTSFANNFENSIDVMDSLSKNGKNKAFRKFLTGLRNRIGCDLQSLLIMPIQRLPRYVLLLGQIKKYTPEADPDHPKISEALQKVSEVAHYINDEKKKLENMNKLNDIQEHLEGSFNLISPTRMYLRDDVMVLLSSSYFHTKKKHRFILFNDIILWTAKKGKYKGCRYLKGLRASSIQDPSDGFALTTRSDDPVRIQCGSEVIKSSWKTSVEKARDEFEGSERIRLQRVDTFRRQSFLDLEALCEDSGPSTIDDVEEDDAESEAEQQDEDRPLDSSELRGLIHDALKQRTIDHVDKAVQTLEQNEAAPEVLTNLKQQMSDIKEALQDPKHNETPIMEELEILEDANKRAATISQKVTESMKKYDGFSKSTRSKKRESIRELSLQTKFGADKNILSDATAEITSIQEEDEDLEVEEKEEEKAAVEDAGYQEFWDKHFSATTICDFRDMKKFYEEDFGIELTNEMCDEMLFQFAFPKNTRFQPHKEFPISLKDFKIVGSALGFPFDISRIQDATKGISGVGVVEAIKLEQFRELMEYGNSEEIDTYLSTGNNWKMLKTKFGYGDSAFHLLAKRGDVDILDVVLSKCNRVGLPKLEKTNANGLLPYHYAEFYGNSEMAAKLKETTAEKVVKKTPVLHEAVRYRYTGCAQRLLEQKACDVNEKNGKGETPLHIASASDNLFMVELLLKHGAKSEDEDIKAAIDSDNSDLLQALLEKRKDDGHEIVTPKDGEAAPFLNHAAFVGTTEVCTVLLDYGSTLQDSDETNETAFLAAAKGGNMHVAKYLQNKDSNVVKDIDIDLRTALHFSAYDADHQMAGSLIDLGVDVNAQDKDGDTCLIISARLGEPDMVGTILECPDTDLNIENHANESALTIAVENGDKTICKALLNRGADGSKVAEKLAELLPGFVPEIDMAFASRPATLPGHINLNYGDELAKIIKDPQWKQKVLDAFFSLKRENVVNIESDLSTGQLRLSLKIGDPSEEETKAEPEPVKPKPEAPEPEETAKATSEPVESSPPEKDLKEAHEENEMKGVSPETQKTLPEQEEKLTEEEAAKRKELQGECVVCGQPPKGPCIETLSGQIIHDSCLACSGCGEKATESIVIREGKVFHKDCVPEADGGVADASQCVVCKEEIPLGSQVARVADNYYHPACFVCAECSSPIQGQFKVRDDKPVCAACVAKVSSGAAPQQCAYCEKPLQGMVIEFSGQKIHKDCFVCQVCKGPIEGGKVFLRNDKPCCETCARG